MQNRTFLAASLSAFAPVPAAALVIWGALVCPPPAAAQEPDPSEVKTSLVSVGESASGPTMEPRDGRWLVDEDGREFFLDKYPKAQGAYRWVDEEKGIVRLQHMMPLEVYSHDDEFFYFKIYRPKVVERPVADPEEQLPLVVDLEEQDNLVLSRADAGLPQQGQWRNGFVFADMNGDGHLDLVHGPARKSFTAPRIFLGDGTGAQWKQWSSVSYPEAPYDYGDVAVADFNGDGSLDMALAIHLTGFVILVGDGQGKFRRWGDGLPVVESVERKGGSGEGKKQPKRTPATFTSRALVATDWTGDGLPDLIALSEGPGSPEHIAEGKLADSGRMLFENQGDGSWKQRPDNTSFMGDNVLLTDFDGDGRTDIVTDSLIMGDNHLINYRDDDEALWRTEFFPVERRRPIIRGIAVADFDGDDRQDLAMSVRGIQNRTQFQAVDLYLARDGEEGAPAWEHRVLASSTEELVNFKSLAAGDIDGDGDSDLVVLTTEGDGWLLANDGQANFVREVSPEMMAPANHRFCAGYRARVVDLDGDGRAEIAANFAGEPGSEQLFAGVAETRCPSRGSLRIWKVAARSP